ncbi:MAG TPA: geranylgeranylglycerol-phosphate geranylgeranyltransferase [Thermoproteota archaeon]|nr:geranylgeranylglycerol-phosphate geranylgeranyltransferase [Thermoproteota archaeon]
MMNAGALFKIVRPADVFLLGTGVIVGYVISTGTLLISTELLAGAMSCGLYTAFAMVTNDIIDMEADKVNEPGRPIPSGKLIPKEALIYSFILLALGVLMAGFTGNIWFLSVPQVVALASVVYNLYLKRIGFLGNILVSTLVASSFIGGGLIAVGHIETYLMLFALMAFVGNLGREVHKGIADVEGDRSKGVMTIAVAYGVQKAKWLSVSLYTAAILLALIPIALGITNGYYPYAIAVVAVLLLASSVRVLRMQKSEELRKEKNLVRVWMLFALLAFVIGALRI